MGFTDEEAVDRLRVKLTELKKEIRRLRSMIRAEHAPEGYNVADDATTRLAVEVATLKQDWLDEIEEFDAGVAAFANDEPNDEPDDAIHGQWLKGYAWAKYQDG